MQQKTLYPFKDEWARMNEADFYTNWSHFKD